MGLIPKFSKEDIDEMLKDGLEENINQLLRIYRTVGVEAVNTARREGNYTNRTGNLRGSIGYLIAVDGDIIESLFDGSGATEAEMLAKDVLLREETGIVLIVVAGMNYASHVESKGYNVLTSAEMKARDEIQQMFKRLEDGNGN